MARVAVIDYGTGNLRSVARALSAVAAGRHDIIVTRQQREIMSADRIVFPGQGAIGQCMRQLCTDGLDLVIKACAADKPLLGICLGLQSLMQRSGEDGGINGLGLIAGDVVRFQDNVRDWQGDIYKVPHIGWNQVRQRCPHPLWQGIADDSWFYFVHSYYVQPASSTDIAASTGYIKEFTSAIARDNIFATQFHPEKSQRPGLTLLDNFLNWDGAM